MSGNRGHVFRAGLGGKLSRDAVIQRGDLSLGVVANLLSFLTRFLQLALSNLQVLGNQRQVVLNIRGLLFSCRHTLFNGVHIVGVALAHRLQVSGRRLSAILRVGRGPPPESQTANREKAENHHGAYCPSRQAILPNYDIAFHHCVAFVLIHFLPLENFGRNSRIGIEQELCHFVSEPTMSVSSLECASCGCTVVLGSGSGDYLALTFLRGSYRLHTEKWFKSEPARESSLACV